MGFLRMGTGSLNILKQIMITEGIGTAKRVTMAGGVIRAAGGAFFRGAGLNPAYRKLGMVGRYGLAAGATHLGLRATYGRGRRRRR